MAARLDEATIVADLKPAEADSRFALVPSRLDACFHGLILLFADLLGDGAGKAYIPVRFGEIRLVRPGAVIARSVIRTRRANERSILADFTLLDAEGEVIATIREGRFQALRTKGGDELAAYAITQRAELATEPTAIPMERRPSVAARLRPLTQPVKGSADASLSPGHLLLEGWATSLAFRLAKGLAQKSGQVALSDPACRRRCGPGSSTPSTPSKAAASPSTRPTRGASATARPCPRPTRSCAGSRRTIPTSRPNWS